MISTRFHPHLLSALFCVVAHFAAAADYVLICHPGSPGVLSKDEMRAVLLGTKIKWANGQVIQLAVLAGGAPHDAVINEFTARGTEQFDKYWRKLVFTGKGIAPTVCDSDAEMLAFLAKTPGGLGYVGAATKIADVKVVEIR